ncbi:GPP34 family phosphoprotein [Streptomyces antibioticus]|uniref:GPP34 family phosphoprotein n=1 Tax=Streptomyces antibioticus TaxID=1890 RepID=UPI0033F53B16
MTTARDLLFVSLDVPSGRPVERGDLSLALAGAELVDLLAAGAASLDGDRVVPVPGAAVGDGSLDEAGSALVRKEPYESVEDWLWRRGDGLAAAYAAGLEAEERSGRPRRSWLARSRADTSASVRPSADAEDRRHAADRWTAREPVLVGLAAALGIPEETAGEPEGLADDTEAVLAAVNGALTELEAVRQRRRIEDAAFDNVWRAP